MVGVMLSIHPEWCIKIADGDKTLEVRKTKPKLKPPFKCYVYCTNPNTTDPYKLLTVRSGNGISWKCNGKVIGEFICDYVHGSYYPANGLVDVVDEKESCLTAKQIIEYANRKLVYFWHISSFQLYDRPKPLGMFKHWVRYGYIRERLVSISRPPQSWCYTEELMEEKDVEQ